LISPIRRIAWWCSSRTATPDWFLFGALVIEAMRLLPPI